VTVIVTVTAIATVIHDECGRHLWMR